MKGMFTTFPFTIHLRGGFTVGKSLYIIVSLESDQYSGSEFRIKVSGPKYFDVPMKSVPEHSL